MKSMVLFDGVGHALMCIRDFASDNISRFLDNREGTYVSLCSKALSSIPSCHKHSFQCPEIFLISRKRTFMGV